jgi:hypothetical protein
VRLTFLFSYVLLMFSSANARLLSFTEEFCEVLSRDDIAAPSTHLRYTAVRAVLLAGEVVLLRFAARLLEKAVRFFFFGLGTLADRVACSWSL